MRGILRRFLSRVFRSGTLEVHTDDERFVVGDGTGEAVAIRFVDRAAERDLVLNPELALGELFTDGRLLVTRGSIYDLLALAGSNLQHGSVPGWARTNEFARRVVRTVHQWNSVSRASRNVAHHYDLSGRLYDLFLDADKQYSCAYFDHPGQSLDDAQRVAPQLVV